ncbi:MAG: hypothetical protein CUN55_21370, partial [Phototrophicales bacterium]
LLLGTTTTRRGVENTAKESIFRFYIHTHKGKKARILAQCANTSTEEYDEYCSADNNENPCGIEPEFRQTWRDEVVRTFVQQRPNAKKQN